MAWLVDGKTFARKVKNPTHGASKHDSADNPMECPSCGHEFTTNEVMPDWPGLPAGVKFDPSDQELLEHLAEQVGINAASRAHPFINEFIPTLNVEDGICYTHPEKLPGVRQDGSSIHFFHRPARAYTTGTRKRRKVQSSDEEGEIRWHKTGKTRPVVDNGRQMGCKKIMVLYVSAGKKAKPEKTNWVMHQYHLGLQEEEREGELVVSKVFYQTQPRQQMAAAMVAKENIDESEHPTPALIGDWRNDLAVLPSMPVTPLPLTAKVAPQQHKGLLESMSEDVHRLQASLSFAMVEGGKEKAESPMLGEEGGSGTEQVELKCEDQVPVGMMGIASVGCKPFSGQPTSPGSFDTERVQLKCEDQVPAGIMCIPSVGPEPFSGQVTFPTDIPNIGPEPFSGQMTHPIDIPNVGSEPFFSSLDADLLKLLCSDDMKKLSQGDGGADWKNIAAEVCSSQDISLDKIVLNTPPDLLEFLFNSQGSTADWNEKVKIWSDSQKTEDFNVNDFFQNSQSLQ